MIAASQKIVKYTKGQKIDLPHEEVKILYESGLTLLEIAQRFGISVEPVKRTLKEANVPRRKAAPRPGVFDGANNPAWRGGRYVREDGYVIVWTPEGYKLEHRVIMEQELGRPLDDAEIVHHIDRNPSNNDPSNLEVIENQTDHVLLHGLENRQRLLASGLKVCTKCFEYKPLSNFYKTRHNRMGVQSWCKNCKNQYDNDRRRKKRGP